MQDNDKNEAAQQQAENERDKVLPSQQLSTEQPVIQSAPSGQPQSDRSIQPKHSAMQVSFQTKADLYSAYMPFVKYGGLFVHTKKDFCLGDDIFVLLELMEESEKYPIQGKVIWHTPMGAQSGLPPGIGVQFTEETATVRKKIETYLAGMLDGERRTDTM